MPNESATDLLELQFAAVVNELRQQPNVAEAMVGRAIYLLTGVEQQDDVVFEDLLMHRTKSEVCTALFRGVADILEAIEASRLDAL